MNTTQTRERAEVIDQRRVRELAPALSATALHRWFYGLGCVEGLPPDQRPVFGPDGSGLGVAKFHDASGNKRGYHQTISVTLSPADSGPMVTLRGRRLAIPNQPGFVERIASGQRGWPPATDDLDYLSTAANLPLKWLRRDTARTDLMAIGTRFKTTREPPIATIEADAQLPFTEVERVLLDFGGVLLAAASVDMQTGLPDTTDALVTTS